MIEWLLPLIGGLISTGATVASQASQNKKKNATDSEIARENMQLQRDLNEQNIEFQREANQQNIDFQREANQQNIDFQRETNAQNEALMREGWQRDDTAYSRKAQDLANAGLSKTLAVGGSAMSSSPVRLQSPSVQAQQIKAIDAGLAPENRYQYNPYTLNAMNLMQMSQEFATSIRSNRQLDLQARKIDSDIKEAEARTKYYDTLTMLRGLDYVFNNDTLDARKAKLSLGNDLIRQHNNLMKSQQYENYARADLWQKNSALRRLDFTYQTKLLDYLPWDKGFDYVNKGTRAFANLTDFAKGLLLAK